MSQNLKPKIRKFVSIWERQTVRHKWRITHSFVLITRVQSVGVSWQESTSGGGTRTGWTFARLNDCRKVENPQFDVPPNHKP